MKEATSILLLWLLVQGHLHTSASNICLMLWLWTIIQTMLQLQGKLDTNWIKLEAFVFTDFFTYELFFFYLLVC